jgi:prefoldin subunit 5
MANWEELKEKIVDAQEELQDSVESIDSKSITTVETVDYYVPDYVQRISEKLEAVQDLEDEIESVSEELAQLTALEAVIFPGKKV